MPGRNKTKFFDSTVDNIEEGYIRSGGKDPYVLTLLTRAHGDNKKNKDKAQRKDVSRTYDTMKQSLIRQYNDVELENVRLLTELKSLQEQIRQQMHGKGGSNMVQSQIKNSNFVQTGHTESPLSMMRKSLASTTLPLLQPHMHASQSLPVMPENVNQSQQNEDALSLLQKSIANAYLPMLPSQMPSLAPNLPYSFPNMSNSRLPFGNTYIVTGDEVHINDGERRPRNATWNDEKRRNNLSSPTFHMDADQDVEGSTNENDDAFFVNNSVPQGPYDSNSGFVIFFDFATKLPKEVRFCRLSVALISGGKMKPPISFPALPTEQYAPGDHAEFRHFTTVCRFAYCVAVAGGKSNESLSNGIDLVAEVMTSTDKPIDEQAPVLGWVRQGWVPISATGKSNYGENGLITYAGRYRTSLRRALPLSRGAEGFLYLTDSTKQQITPHNTELFYRIVNTKQSHTERLAPVGIKFIEFYNER